MEVYIGNLPGAATLIEIRDFIGNFGLRADFQTCRGRDSLARNYHFLIARTETRRQGLELIARLNGHLLADQHLVARECIERKAVKEWGGAERRVNPW